MSDCASQSGRVAPSTAKIARRRSVRCNTHQLSSLRRIARGSDQPSPAVPATLGVVIISRVIGMFTPRVEPAGFELTHYRNVDRPYSGAGTPSRDGEGAWRQRDLGWR